jgi:hypothetical protein
MILKSEILSEVPESKRLLLNDPEEQYKEEYFFDVQARIAEASMSQRRPDLYQHIQMLNN